jgi:glycolate oxidase iron-sulfur subunit
MNAARAALAARADECVMCGLCLPHCPTFRLSGLEARSPRGRIALAKALAADGTAEASVADALRTCLQCRACEAVCPAQVRYGEIIEGARALLHRPRRRHALERAASHPATTGATLSIAWPRRTHLACTDAPVGRRARWLLRASKPLLATAPGHTRNSAVHRLPVRAASTASAQQALVDVCAGISVDLRPCWQTPACCGAISRHLGDPAGDADAHGRSQPRGLATSADPRGGGAGQRLHRVRCGAARAMSASPKPAAGCWHVATTWAPRLRTLPARIGLFAPCTHRHVLRRCRRGARRCWRLLPGVEVVPIDAGYGCCGAAGPHLLAITRSRLMRWRCRSSSSHRGTADWTRWRRRMSAATCISAERLRLARRQRCQLLHPVACLARSTVDNAMTRPEPTAARTFQPRPPARRSRPCAAHGAGACRGAGPPESGSAASTRAWNWTTRSAATWPG